MANFSSNSQKGARGIKIEKEDENVEIVRPNERMLM